MREMIRREIEAVEAPDRVEQDHRTRALAWLDAGAPLYRTAAPATPPQHLVAYFVLTDGEHILLVDHKKAQLWLPPGGHVEPDEHPRDTVVREMREELNCSPTHEIGAPILITCDRTVGLTAGHVDVCLWYRVQADSNWAINCAEEFNAVRWFGFAEVPFERAHPAMRRLFAKFRPNPTTERTANHSYFNT
jgi:8-oxo-dGTP pyrophosphatase MutT (NUDIX family)